MIEKLVPYKIKVYNKIKDDIINGVYVPGDVLNERGLADALGISRTPIREALQMLAQDGWVSIESYKKATVREYDIKHMNELQRIRDVLECCAIEDAVDHITELDMKNLEQLQEEQVKALREYKANSFIELDRKFHNYIYRLSGNNELIHLLQNYYDMFLFIGIQAVSNTEERKSNVLKEHEAILEALRERDKEKAKNAMHQHMNVTKENMLSRLQNVCHTEKKRIRTEKLDNITRKD